MTEVPQEKANKGYEQGDINRLFDHYNLSFCNPDEIVRTICTHWIRYRDIVWGLNRCYWVFRESGARDLYYIMVQISESPNHRHRVDAKNIAAECRRRVSKGFTLEPYDPLEPYPKPQPSDYEAAKGSPPSSLPPSPPTKPERSKAGVGRKPTFLTLQMTEVPPEALPTPPPDPSADYARKLVTPERQVGDPLPEAFEVPIPSTSAPPREQAAENDQIRRIIEGLTADKKANDLILKNIQAIKDSRLWNPPLHPESRLDDPAEVCLLLEEDCPFVVHPTPQVDESIADRSNWNPTVVYDLRPMPRSGAKREDAGPIDSKNYIWVLFDMIRETLINPDVARAYAIIARAHPSRYAHGSVDDIGDEPPPTAEEIECMMHFIAKSFPPIFIIDKVSGGKFEAAVGIHEVFGIVPRGAPGESHRIYFSGFLFDQVERAHSQGIPYYHMLLVIMMSFTHELGHYLNTCFYLGSRDEVAIDTPRKIRLELEPNPKEDPHHPEHIPLLAKRGELGQVIEWLVFGFMAQTGKGLTNSECFKQPLRVVAWGSYPDPDEERQEIRIDSFAAEKLLRVRGRTRLTAFQLREWLGSLEGAREAATRSARYLGRRG